MYYLEDYLEKLEYLPDDIRKNLMKLGKMDHNVMMSMDNIRQKLDILFSKADGMKPEELEKQYKAIMAEGQKSVEQSERKIQLADKMQNLMTKYIERLDQEIHKFKMEMEADYSGITEHIEKRSLDSEESSIRYPPLTKDQINKRLFGEKKGKMYNVSRPKQKTVAYSATSNIDVAQSSQCNPNPIHTLMTLPNSLEQSKACSSAILTTSQMISDTQQFSQLQSDDSSVVSIEALSPDISFGSGMVTDAILPELCSSETSKSERIKQEEMDDVVVLSDDDTSGSSDGDKTLYCICNDVAHGTMVACDNKKCPYEWFHCECVGIKNPPKGKWYCPKCKKNSSKNRRARK